MKRLVLIGMFGLMLSACGDADINSARNVVKQQLNDPSSADFRNEKVYHGIGDVIVCGEVNAKNGFGGYTGYTPYWRELTHSPRLSFLRKASWRLKSHASLPKKMNA